MQAREVLFRGVGIPTGQVVVTVRIVNTCCEVWLCRVCTTVRLLTKKSIFSEDNKVVENVLKELCKTGRRHVLQETVMQRHPQVSTTKVGECYGSVPTLNTYR